jgi:hypothetical protein
MTNASGPVPLRPRLALITAITVFTIGACSAAPAQSPSAAAEGSASPSPAVVVTPAPTATAPAPVVSPVSSQDAALRARALSVLARWERAVAAAGGQPAVVPVGDLTGQIGSWEEAVGDNNKRALMAGQVFTESELTNPAPASAQVIWADGTTVTVPVIGAQEAIAAISSSVVGSPSGICNGCRPLTAVAAQLETTDFMTTRGPATGPTWVFTIRGTAAKVTRVAIANPVTVPPLDDAPGGAVEIDAAATRVGDRTMTVSFTGAPGTGDKPCGEDYTAEAVESALAITVIVTRHPYAGAYPSASGGVVACAAIGARRTATVALAAPIGERSVLDLATGQPVSLKLEP